MNWRVVQYDAKCENCPCPLTLYYGSWSHHWLYSNACHDPAPINATRDGMPIDPVTMLTLPQDGE